MGMKQGKAQAPKQRHPEHVTHLSTSTSWQTEMPRLPWLEVPAPDPYLRCEILLLWRQWAMKLRRGKKFCCVLSERGDVTPRLA